MGDNLLFKHLQVYLAEIWRARWRVLAVTWLVCLIGWTAVALIPSRYTASTQVYVDTTTLLTPLMKNLAVQPATEEQVSVVRRTLLSRPNLEQLLRMTDLDLAIETDADREAKISALQKEIEITADRDQLFTMVYSHSDPKTAQKVVQALLNIFVEQNVGRNRRDMEMARGFIEEQIRDHERRLRETELKVAEFRAQNLAQIEAKQQIDREIARAEEEIRRFTLQMETAQWAREQARVEMTREPETLNPDTIDPAKVALGQPTEEATTLQQLATMRKTLTSLQASKTPQHPDVVALKREIAAIEAEFGADEGRKGLPNPAWQRLEDAVRQADLEISSLSQRIDSRRQHIDSLKRQAEEMPDVSTKLDDMRRDYDVIKANYDQLVQRRESALMAEQLESKTTNVEFRIVDPPVLPIRPSAPNRPLLFAGVLFAGLAVGIGLQFLIIQFRNSFPSAQRLRDRLDIPVLGSVSMAALRATPGRMTIETTGLVVVTAALLLTFIAIQYTYMTSPTPPDVGAMISNLGADLRLLFL